MYAHKDENNHFWIKKWNEDKPNITDPDTPIEFVRHGDLIRLEHVPSREKLKNCHAAFAKKYFRAAALAVSLILNL